jgi:hypothetical protein
MFVFPGRVYAMSPDDAVEKIYRHVAARGFKILGAITIKVCEAQTRELDIWYEFYVRVEEIGT